MQTMLNRNPGILTLADGIFGPLTSSSVQSFQKASGLEETGIFENFTAAALLSCCLQDSYFDNGTAASVYGKLYKILVPLSSTNRSIEAIATLLDKDNNIIRNFIVRTHGRFIASNVYFTGLMPSSY